MYLFDFMKHLFRKSNIYTIIYLILNIFIIIGFIGLPLAEGDPAAAIIVGPLLYFMSLGIALSPIGEFILRYQTGCKQIKDVKTLNFIEPIFREVYKKAKKMNPNIPDNVDLYLSESMDVNAFATGRKTVCITRGMLMQKPELIKATLGHEMGHLAHHDTDLILLVTIGNLITNILFISIRFISRAITLISSIFASGSRNGVLYVLSIQLCGFITDVCLMGMMFLWTKVGTALVMKTSRSNEFEADEFSFNLGYGLALCQLLDTFPANHDKGLFASLASSHPDKYDRIQRLRELGVKY